MISMIHSTLKLAREGLLATLTLITLAGLSSTMATGQTTIKVGWINSNTGFVAQPAEQMEKGFNLYVKVHSKDLPPNVKLEIVRRDDGASAEVSKRLAQELITREKVQLLVGVLFSPAAAAIAPLTAESKTPLLITNAGGVSVPRMSPYIARVSFTQWHTALPLGRWVAEKGMKRGYSVVSDYTAGHDGETAFVRGFTDAGGQMAGTLRFPPNTSDFAPFIQRVKDAKPDVLFIWVPTGPQVTAILKTMRDLGLRDTNIQIVSTHDLLPDEELPGLGANGSGIITAGTYSTTNDIAANRVFLEAWDKEYKGTAIPNFVSIGGWDGAAALFDLVKKTGGKFTGDEAVAFFSQWKNPNSPRGPISIDPATRDVIQNVYIRRSEMKAGKLENVTFETIPSVKDGWKELNPAK